MTRLLVGDDPRFTVDPIEIERGGLSFTVDTLATLAGRWPEAELVLLVGADVLSSFHLWREPARVRALATLAVLTRATGDDAGAARVPDATGTPPLEPPPCVVRTRRIDVSSTEIRARIQAGQSIRGFVPEAVADYIRSARLYR